MDVRIIAVHYNSTTATWQRDRKHLSSSLVISAPTAARISFTIFFFLSLTAEIFEFRPRLAVQRIYYGIVNRSSLKLDRSRVG